MDEILWWDHLNESSLPGAICYSKFHKMKFENLAEICFWLNLAVRVLRNSFWQYRWIFPNWPPPNVIKNRGRVHFKELVQNISTYFQRKSKWKGLRNSFWQYRRIFPNWPPPNVKKNRGKVHCKELVQNISTYFQRQKLEWTANTTTVQAPPLLLVDQRLRLSLYCWDRSVLSLVPYLN